MCDEKTQNSLIRHIARIEKRLTKQVKKISDIEIQVYEAASDLKLLLEQIDISPVSYSKGISSQMMSLAKIHCPHKSVLEEEARKGVSFLEIHEQEDGSAKVRIENSIPFVLSPLLSLLLSFLAKDIGPVSNSDEMVGWKTKEEIILWMNLKTGKTFSTHSIDQLIHRLRREIENQAHLNRYLIQTSEKGRLRFALRRKGYCDLKVKDVIAEKYRNITT